MSRQKRIVHRDEEDVTIVTFVDRKILDEHILWISEDLFQLVDEFGKKNIILDFGTVENFSYPALGMLISLNMKVKGAGGKLVICEVSKGYAGGVDGVFRVTAVNTFFFAYFTKDPKEPRKTLQEALKKFSPSP